MLTAAGLADRHLPRDGAGAGSPSWPSAQGGLVIRWLEDSPPRASAADETVTSGHLHQECGSDFTPELERFLTLTL